MTWHPLCDLDALAVGTPRGVRIDRVGICLVRTADGIFAVPFPCPTETSTGTRSSAGCTDRDSTCARVRR